MEFQGLYVLCAVLVAPCGKRSYVVYMDATIKLLEEAEYFRKFAPDLENPKLYNDKTVHEILVIYDTRMVYDKSSHQGDKFKYFTILRTLFSQS